MLYWIPTVLAVQLKVKSMILMKSCWYMYAGCPARKGNCTGGPVLWLCLSFSFLSSVFCSIKKRSRWCPFSLICGKGSSAWQWLLILVSNSFVWGCKNVQKGFVRKALDTGFPAQTFLSFSLSFFHSGHRQPVAWLGKRIWTGDPVRWLPCWRKKVAQHKHFSLSLSLFLPSPFYPSLLLNLFSYFLIFVDGLVNI